MIPDLPNTPSPLRSPFFRSRISNPIIPTSFACVTTDGSAADSAQPCNPATQIPQLLGVRPNRGFITEFGRFTTINDLLRVLPLTSPRRHRLFRVTHLALYARLPTIPMFFLRNGFRCGLHTDSSTCLSPLPVFWTPSAVRRYLSSPTPALGMARVRASPTLLCEQPWKVSSKSPIILRLRMFPFPLVTRPCTYNTFQSTLQALR